jgi:hypothetical protein
MSIVVVVVMVVMRVGEGRPSADMNIIVVSFDDHNVVCVLGAVVVVVVVVAVVVVVVVVTVTWIWDGNWGTTVESDVAVHPVDVNVGARFSLVLCRLL